MTDGRIVALGDACVSLQFAAAIDPTVNAGCIAAADSLERLAVLGVRDIVPTYNTVTVHFDPLATSRDALSELLSQLAATPPG